MELKKQITTKSFSRLSYLRRGEGPALMLLHGFPASGRIWEPVVEKLAQAHCLLIPDIPGSGDSLPGLPLPGMETLAEIVPAILEQEGIAHCVLAGHSMGGYLALAAAEAYPERLRGLMLVHSTALADTVEKKEVRDKSIRLIQKGGREGFIRGMVPTLFAAAFAAAHPEAVAALGQQGLQLRDEGMIAFYHAMKNRPDRTRVLVQAPFPVAWFLGREDQVIPWQSCLQQSSLPHVTFISLNDSCGHMGMIEQPELLSEQLIQFSGFCDQRARHAL